MEIADLKFMSGLPLEGWARIDRLGFDREPDFDPETKGRTRYPLRAFMDDGTVRNLGRVEYRDKGWCYVDGEDVSRDFWSSGEARSWALGMLWRHCQWAAIKVREGLGIKEAGKPAD